MKQKKIKLEYNKRQVTTEKGGTRNEVDVKEFTLQNPGAAWYLEMTDRAKIEGQGLIISQKFAYEQYLEHVVVDPKMNLSDFDNISGGLELLNLLIGECESFLTGRT